MMRRGALFAIIALVFIAVGAAILTVRMAARSIDATASAQAAEAPEISRLYVARYGSLAAAAPTIVKHIMRPGLYVRLRDARTREIYDERGAFADRGHSFPGSPDGPNPMYIVLAILAGEEVQHAAIPGGDVVIFPALDSILGVLRSVGVALGCVLLFSATSVWLYVRGVRLAALRPLRETTISLQRLAERDFAPRTIVSGAGTAYDELARAYNAAVAAVSSAFAERRTAEIEMQRFIADAGHELRTPLTIVMGYLDIIDGGALTDPRIAGRVIAGMRTESLRMRKLIDKLIILARMETPSEIDRRSDIDIVSLVARVIESLEPLLVQDIDVTGAPFAHVYANEDDLAEALTNIIENGLKYAPRSRITIGIDRTVDRVIIVIADRGPGMSTDERRNAFERFYRGEARGDIAGSGLGLAIAKRAVERAGGTIDLHSVAGLGTTLTIELPETPISVADPPQLARR